MIIKVLSIEERLRLLKEKRPALNMDILKQDLYSYDFEHPSYKGRSGSCKNEARHALLDELNVPRTLINE